MSPLVGKALPPGGTIGIVAPASPYTMYSDVLRGIAWWEAKGYRVKLAENALQRTGWMAGSPEQRSARRRLSLRPDTHAGYAVGGRP